jgi:hypothetical protein
VVIASERPGSPGIDRRAWRQSGSRILCNGNPRLGVGVSLHGVAREGFQASYPFRHSIRSPWDPVRGQLPHGRQSSQELHASFARFGRERGVPATNPHPLIGANPACCRAEHIGVGNTGESPAGILLSWTPAEMTHLFSEPSRESLPSAPELSDHRYSAIKGAISAVPLIGGILAEEMGLVLSPALCRRRDEWFEDLARAELSSSPGRDQPSIRDLA